MKWRKLIFVAFVLLLFGVGYRYSRSLPAVQATTIISAPKISQAISLPWPTYGQGALAAQGYGMLQTHGQQKAVPMASIAKVVTALAVLKKKSLATGETGPSITINSDDEAIYNKYYSQGGSVTKVAVGQQISEYQALQALLIPSSNNMADSLARWAFGSMENYLTYANNMLQGLTLKQTKVADASGFSALSVSAPQDLVKLGLTVVENPVLAGIVAQQTVNLPVSGEVNNVNWLLGSDGVIGIKTGNTNEAGGCFLFAAKRSVSGQTVILVGALMQAPDLNTVINDARTLITASDSGFEFTKVVTKDQAIGTYKTAWGASAEAVASQDFSVLAWRGSQVSVTPKLNNIAAPALAGAAAGSISITSGQKTASVPVVLTSNLSGPSWLWRLFR